MKKYSKLGATLKDQIFELVELKRKLRMKKVQKVYLKK